MRKKFIPQLTRRALRTVVTIFAVVYCLTWGAVLKCWRPWTHTSDSRFSVRNPPRSLRQVPLQGPHTLHRSGHGDNIDDPRLQDSGEQVEVEGTLFPGQIWRGGEFACLRWVATTNDGGPTGETRECWQRVRSGEAGYCVVRNETSGQVFHVMHTTTLSIGGDVRFTCHLAQAFSNYRHELKVAGTPQPPDRITTTRSTPVKTTKLKRKGIQDERDIQANAAYHGNHTNGIVMAIYDQVIVSAFASIRQLRAVGCLLPIELWTRYDELSATNAIVHELLRHYGPITLRTIHDDSVHGFYVKIHAVYNSSFANVLLLDADNFAVRNPAFLFSTQSFLEHGAVFWPDYWHPANTIFNVHAQSLLWELLGIDYVDMLEQESGQVLINRIRSRPALERLLLMTRHQPNLLTKLRLVWGDKDLFRLAWLHANQSFHFVGQVHGHGGHRVHRLPGAVGVVNPHRQRFCGMSMVQYEPEHERILFVHRNTIKLTGHSDQTMWHVLQEYPATIPVDNHGHNADTRTGAVREHRYGKGETSMKSENGISSLVAIQSFNGRKVFNETSCFGVKKFANLMARGNVDMHGVNSVPELRGLEDTLIQFAAEANRLLQSQQGCERELSNSKVDKLA